ncbi:hypothetical protein [Bacillus sp. 37MA]|uniref:hypothetical protein n=1 Tax=Bacillus sp. 37MA TaxID=1132442 RepID=UPI0003637E73|nr:hypothetical protein [Bacillus sp. 37MA]
MDIMIRNLDPVAIKKMDEVAKKQGISRQEFLKNQIETMAFYREETNREVHLQNIIEKNTLLMALFNESIERMNLFLESMIEE